MVETYDLLIVRFVMIADYIIRKTLLILSLNQIVQQTLKDIEAVLINNLVFTMTVIELFYKLL